MKDHTLVFLLKPKQKQILLAMKKRGFGKGKWNGVGGKVEKGETIEAGAVREAYEEIGVAMAPQVLTKVAVIEFRFADKSAPDIRGHVFFAERWAGEPTETEEMRPKWYPMNALPYKKMWVDDTYWLPRVLAGEKLTAKFTFSQDGSKVLDMDIQNLP